MRDWCINIKLMKLVIKKISLSIVSLTLENEASKVYVLFYYIYLFIFLLDNLGYGTLFSVTEVFDYHFYLFLLQYVFYVCQIWIIFILRAIYLYFHGLTFLVNDTKKIFHNVSANKTCKIHRKQVVSVFCCFYTKQMLNNSFYSECVTTD